MNQSQETYQQETQRPMTFWQFLKHYVKQGVSALRHPKQLIPTLLLGVVWTVLSVAAAKVKLWAPFEVLSFLTFAQGGMYGGIVGAVGGIIGKVMVATCMNVMIVPLFYKQNPFKDFGSSAKSLFSGLKVSSMQALYPLLIAIGAAMLLYCFLNINQMRHNSMVGIVAAVMLLKNMGSRGGFVWDFLLSAAGAMSGHKMPDMQTINRILTGMSLGFMVAVGLSFAQLQMSVWIGAGFLAIGIVCAIMGRKAKASDLGQPS